MSTFTSREKSIVAKRVDGIRVYTSNRTFVDGISGMFNLPFGFSNRKLRDDICRQFNEFAFLPKEQIYDERLPIVSNELLNVANMVGGATLIVTDGSSAIEASLALALEYQRISGHSEAKDFISFHHSYHGASLGAHTVSGRRGFSEIRHPGYNTIKIFPHFSYFQRGRRSPAWTLEEIEQTILANNPQRIAGLIVEPTNHLGGMRERKPEYLQGLKLICENYDIVLIADEIVTGAYRTGPFLNFHKANILPDIVVLGKGISGGYVPASAMLASAKIVAKFDLDDEWVKFSYSHTYAANSIALVAVNSSLNLFKTDEIQESNKRLAIRLNEMADNLKDVTGVVRAESNGLLLGITLSSELGLNCGKKIEHACFEQGLIVRGEDDWIALAPAYITSDLDIEYINEGISNAIATLK